MSYRFVLIIIGVCVLFLDSTYVVRGQGVDFLSASTAQTYAVVDEVAEPGDIVVFDEVTSEYRLSLPGDTVLVGVIVENPLILLETDPDGAAVAETGEATVNVSTLGGAIAVGDLISPSPIPGKGQRARSGERAIGVAREAFNTASTTIDVDGNTIAVGSIQVILRGTQAQIATQSGVAPLQGQTGGSGGPVPQAFKYVMALLIGVGSVYVSFRNFGTNIRSGIISIGRNPLAKTTIQAMVVLNIVLIVLVAGGGLILSIAILLLPF